MSKRKIGILCVAIAAFAAAGTVARAAEDQAVVAAGDDGASPSKAAPVGPFVKQSKACGNADNLFFCGAINSKTEGTLYLAPYSVKFGTKGKALVTWNGTVYCEVDSIDNKPAGNSALSSVQYFAHLGLVTGPSEDFKPNSTGTTSVGEQLSIYTAVNTQSPSGSFRRVLLAPVTLSKLYDVKKAKTVDFRVAVKPDYRLFEDIAGLTFCNINNGTTTVQFTTN